VGVVVVAAVATALTVPGSREAAHERERSEARQEQARQDRRIRALRERMRPHVVRATSIAPLERAIARDARRRTGQEILRTDCERKALGASERALPGLRLSCLAVRTEFSPSEATTGGLLGYPYAALARFARGRAAYCRVFGIAAEGGLTKRQELTIPRMCGGRG